MNTMKLVFTKAQRFIVRHRTVLLTTVVMCALLLVRTGAAHAGTDVTFDDLNILIEGWTKGSLGKALALIALVLGIGIAAARQSFAALFAGVGVAAGASIGPGVINQVITATF
jgi:hypothetical protein